MKCDGIREFGVCMGIFRDTTDIMASGYKNGELHEQKMEGKLVTRLGLQGA